MNQSDVQMLKREMNKETGRALAFFFVYLPAALFVLAYLWIA